MEDLTTTILRETCSSEGLKEEIKTTETKNRITKDPEIITRESQLPRKLAKLSQVKKNRRQG